MTAQQVFLHVGCGPLRQAQAGPGFRSAEAWRELRLDIDPAVRPDIIGTMTDMAALGDGSVDAVYSAHNIEHLYPHEVPAALAEFRRVLRPDGFVVIACPDLQALGETIARGEIDQPLYDSPAGPIAALDILFGHRGRMAAGNLYMAHRTGFTAASLKAALKAAGLIPVAVNRYPKAYELWAIAAKTVTDIPRLQALPGQHFPR